MMYQQLMEMWTLLLDRYLSTRWWHCNHSLYYFVMQVISYKGHSTVIQQSVKEHHWKFGHIITCPIKKGVLHFADYKENVECKSFQTATIQQLRASNITLSIASFPGGLGMRVSFFRKGKVNPKPQINFCILWPEPTEQGFTLLTPVL